MNPNFLTDGGGLSLYSYPTEQFKAGLLSLSVLTPVREREGMLASLLFSVLRRGCKSYPTLDALNRRLDSLYGTELSLRSYARGDRLVTGVVLELLDGAYRPEGDADLMEDALAVVRELLFCPLTDEEGYEPEARGGAIEKYFKPGHKYVIRFRCYTPMIVKGPSEPIYHT